jgi:hypothetical protein
VTLEPQGRRLVYLVNDACRVQVSLGPQGGVHRDCADAVGGHGNDFLAAALEQPSRQLAELGVVCVTGTRPFSIRSDRHRSCRGLLRIAKNWCTGQVAGSTHLTGITEPGAHPGRILVVIGTPIALAITGSSISCLTRTLVLRSTAWASDPSAAPLASPTADTSHLRYRDRPFTQS